MNRARILLAALILLIATLTTTAAAPRRDLDGRVLAGGLTHVYHLYIPSSYRAGRPMPLVLLFHGGGGDAQNIEETTQMRATAERHGFLLVRPEGYDARGRGLRTFNAGACCGPSVTRNIDHVSAVAAILDAIERDYSVDRNRVYATGHSNGGMMAYRLAVEMPDRIAAIAPNASYLVVEHPPSPSRPVPVFHMHGLADRCAPFAGGPSDGFDRSVRPPVRASIDFFVKANACNASPRVTYEHGAAHCVTYGGCRAGADVVLCTIDGGGHAWPGAPRYALRTQHTCGGALTQDLDANEAMWAFFMAHPLRWK